MSTEQIKFSANSQAAEALNATALARRYRLEYVDLATTPIDYSLIHKMPVELMVRHHFVPVQRDEFSIQIAMVDPSNLELLDELSALLKTRLRTLVATPSAIQEVLKRS